jgi:hypothetical protein
MLIMLCSISLASAFAPAAKPATSSALKMSFANELGAQPPLGYWDPLGLLKDADQERFDRLRYVRTCISRCFRSTTVDNIFNIYEFL